MKTWISLFISLFFFLGCADQPKFHSSATDFEKSIPAAKLVKNENNEWQFATGWSHSLSLTPNAESSAEFFIQTAAVPLVQTDLINQISFIDLPVGKNEFHDHPPTIGGTVAWMVGSQVQTGIVQKISAENFTVAGSVGSPIIGSPVFDVDGTLYGILVSADPQKETLTALRSETIQRSWTQ